MQRCLQLAILGAGNTAPNPMVGAVLVHAGKIIGEGYHQQYGGPHAEVNCINSVADADKDLIEKSTLYVSLEPCSHFGKTPPCTDLVIANKIPEVVIGCRDSFAAVDGKGIERLMAAGIQVNVGILEKECRELNKRFFTFHEKHRPYIILKWAQSSDGKIAARGADRIFISNEITNRLVHQWRTEEAAILVGTNTVLLDDPALTARLWPGKDPVRLVIDKELKLPVHLKLFDGSVKTIVFNYIKQSATENLVYHRLNKEEGIPVQILSALYNMQLQSVMVEGGSKLLQSLIDEGFWDEARVITNSAMVIGEGLDAPVLKNEMELSEQKIENDVISYFTRK
ncbi:MAG: bifunctional diaminohydroxyphosphoribosylaminopyrimidine deaminase/5-amino-6-(5-phosphoribosylamino)uracil reductase RibD [Chitinophagaceae bacterium]|nr:bifunctional diaminohydroxyphosphoribosylaminopyrimidine deaminase/5-amino-6-(5-phosphoribosylamino)uracil reductase RibD [Chitinophagaceae bacterium]MBK9531417.1 bifunctional diaminohydroxyphosphoribosylaminopyrimidine deaminase/5-amino-6-(5-phosphoribosylamino)uracil reductase RibD [Chitinophagaceae bacterium]